VDISIMLFYFYILFIYQMYYM